MSGFYYETKIDLSIVEEASLELSDIKKNLLLRQKTNNEKFSKGKKIKAFTYKYSFY